ncbi:protein sip-5 [Luteimonas sp. gir]|uniref:protein sip-5 n=1 Tax=Luteimonas sp. gir TaxID=3127960 RepID=UPI003075CC61
MNFEGLKTRVERAEALVDGRVVQTLDRHAALRSSWREAWTPSRIVIAGLIGGFAMGVSQPKRALRRLGKIGGPKSLQMISALSGLASSIQATIAAVSAKQAAEAADASEDAAADAATEATSPTASAAATAPPVDPAAASAHVTTGADDTVTVSVPSPRADRRRPEPTHDAQPRPAEAATEISESGR